MKQQKMYAANQDIPGQDKYIAVIEEKIRQVLGSQLSGQFHMLVDPNGFHYGFHYGPNSYYNEKSLKDLDRTLMIDDTTNQLSFNLQPFSGLYDNVLRCTGYKLSKDDLTYLNNEDIKAQVYTNALNNAFKYDFPDVTIPPTISPIAFIFQYIDKEFGSIDKIPLYYRNTKNAMMDYNNNAAASFLMHRKIADAQNRIAQLLSNIEKPSTTNKGLQTGKDTYYVGYDLPDFGQTFSSICTDSNKIDISLAFDQFTEHTSRLSIEHEAAFLVPFAICVFGKSDTKYTLENLVTNETTVDMQFTYKGITTFAPNPELAGTTGVTGWYDEQILLELIKNTGKDNTGYCLVNSEYNVNTLFGPNCEFSRLKEFVICQPPVITITMKKSNTQMVSQLFEHKSHIDVDFFGFGISSSSQDYSVDDFSISSDQQTITITLKAPDPAVSASTENLVAYVLGGVPSYPPQSIKTSLEKHLTFQFPMSGMLTNSLTSSNLCGKLKLLPGTHTKSYYLGKMNNSNIVTETLDAYLKIWYHYVPGENTLWLSDADDLSSDKAQLMLFDKDGQISKILTNHSCTDSNITMELTQFMENLIQEAEKNGLSVIRRRMLPDAYKGLFYYQTPNTLKPLESTFYGTRKIGNGQEFVNALGTTGDTPVDNHGNPIPFTSWIELWSQETGLNPTSCTNCTNHNNLYGAHVLLNTPNSVAPLPGTNVDIVPLCPTCNNYHNVNPMYANSNTKSVVMIW